MKRLILLFISTLFVVFTFAQQIQLRGKVRSTDGEELIGVSVYVEGSSTGTVTDLNGSYSSS